VPWTVPENRNGIRAHDNSLSKIDANSEQSFPPSTSPSPTRLLARLTTPATRRG
jgi:hypothetical protein